MPPTVVLKLGGELVEQPADLERIAASIARLARRASLVVVHGGGREIDAALAAAGIPKVQVDGIRVTDAPTLGVVVSVLAGAINTRLVAAARRAGVDAVGLTGADAGVVTVRRAPPLKTANGSRVSLGLVGAPAADGAPRLLRDLLTRGYVPVIACIGAARDGQLLNVNADTLAGHLAATLRARRLIIAGGTAGVLNEEGRTIARLKARDAAGMIRSGTANAGMVAKLQACRTALRRGVREVVIVDGRHPKLGSLADAPRSSIEGFTQVVQ